MSESNGQLRAGPARDDGTRTGAAEPGTVDGGVFLPRRPPALAFEDMEGIARENGGEFRLPKQYEGSFGRTLFDTPQSQDGQVTVVLPRDKIDDVTTQALVRIVSYPDGRAYVGVVDAGPFYDPNGLRADSPTMVVSAVHGTITMPDHHGRIEVSVIGSDLGNGKVGPANRRPRPNSPVFTVPDSEMPGILGLRGDFPIGVVSGHETVEVPVPVHDKAVLYRHTGILGTTGGGKSTTVTNFIGGLRAHGAAVVLLDTEGEYTTINEPTDKKEMEELLAARGMAPAGMPDTHVYHLVGRETANPDHPSVTPFTLSFEALSPFALMEILDMNDAQQTRFLSAYDLAKRLLREAQVFPKPNDKDDERRVAEYDEQEEGYPGLTFPFMVDVVTAVIHRFQETEPDFWLTPGIMGKQWAKLKPMVAAANLEASLPSWKKVSGMLWRIQRLGIFDNPKAKPLDCRAMAAPGRVNIIDLSDLDGAMLRNLAIAQVLRQLQAVQEQNYVDALARDERPTPLNVMVEEAHEFLSSARIRQMPTLYQQVAKIAKRGRKRWLGLTFITQLPQNLPDEVMALINNWILHKIQDESVVNRLRRTVPTIDPSMWRMIASLRPGQAVVQFAHMGRPILTAMHPSPYRLRLEN